MSDADELEREWMVRTQIEDRGVRSPALLDAMRRLPRQDFVPAQLRAQSTEDRPLPIGHGATISQPYIVAKMTELLKVGPGSRVLDVGTGSGYQAALLAALGCEVWSIERVQALADRADRVLRQCGLDVHLRVGDGHQGWPEAAPFDGIVVGAAARRVPVALLDQLARGGRMVIPVGDENDQELVVMEHGPRGFVRKRQFAVLFVPLVEEAG